MFRDRSPLAGQTVTIRDHVAEIGGQEYRVEDWWQNVAGQSWGTCDGNPAALKYAIRAGLSGITPDDEVLYGKVCALGYLVHVSEIEAAATA